MWKIISVIVLGATIYICALTAEKKQGAINIDGGAVSVDTGVLKYKQRAYVPVNAPVRTNKNTLLGKTILKVRNTSFTDSLYLTRVEYYDADGMLLKNFIQSILLVLPMATKEIVVQGNEFRKPGDNFIVQWYLNDPMHRPIIEAVSFDADSRMLMKQEGILLDVQ